MSREVAESPGVAAIADVATGDGGPMIKTPDAAANLDLLEVRDLVFDVTGYEDLERSLEAVKRRRAFCLVEGT